MATRRSLSERQLDVLQWIEQGCPDRSWPDHTHKATARALQGRGYANVSRKGGVWTAEITDAGRYYLAHGHPPEPPRAIRRASTPAVTRPAGGRAKPETRRRFEVAGLIEQVQASGGELRVADPEPELRAAYRRAISAATATKAAPDGFVLRHTGRDRGDLVIRLVRAEDVSRVDPPQPVPIVDSITEVHPEVRRLESRSRGRGVADEAQPRALRVAQSIAAEAVSRGYTFAAADQPWSFRIGIAEDSFDFSMSEELDEVEEFPSEEIEAAKYDWQRVSAATVSVPSGRLVLELTDGYNSRRWADRKRWNLESRLPLAFQYVEDKARQARERRLAAAERLEELREEWKVAGPRARERYIAEVNRKRLHKQMEAWIESRDLYAYSAALRSRADEADGPQETQRIAAWAEWVGDEARRRDPLAKPDRLRIVVPGDIPSYELDRFMPNGMTVRHPPEES